MSPKINHSWNLTEQEACLLQRELAAKVIREDRLGEVRLVAGVDVAYQENSDRSVAAAVVLDAGTLNVVESATTEDSTRFPYIPGLLSFRELPPIALALQQLKVTPDLIVCDGQGIAHPRRFGLACHLGILFDVPTIGCGKTPLTGEAASPERQRGAVAPLVDNGEIVGNALRTQTGINPVFVSVGHKVSLSTACDWILGLSPKYRLPETTRSADRLVRRFLRTSM